VSSLQPTSTGRSGFGWPVLAVAVVLALAAGAVFGWWLSGRDIGGSAEPVPTTAPCPTPSPLPAPATVTVNVYNATTKGGLAKSASEQMAERGFAIGDVDNDPLEVAVTGVAVVRHGPQGERSAQLVAANVAGATLLVDGREDASVDLVLGNQFTALATPTETQAAVDAANAAPETC
jgi:hypothetical protein